MRAARRTRQTGNRERRAESGAAHGAAPAATSTRSRGFPRRRAVHGAACAHRPLMPKRFFDEPYGTTGGVNVINRGSVRTVGPGKRDRVASNSFTVSHADFEVASVVNTAIEA